MSWSLLGLGCLMWMTYGARIGVVPQIPGNIILVSGALIVVMLIPSDRSRAYRLVPLAGCRDRTLRGRDAHPRARRRLPRVRDRPRVVVAAGIRLDSDVASRPFVRGVGQFMVAASRVAGRLARVRDRERRSARVDRRQHCALHGQLPHRARVAVPGKGDRHCSHIVSASSAGTASGARWHRRVRGNQPEMCARGVGYRSDAPIGRVFGGIMIEPPSSTTLASWHRCRRRRRRSPNALAHLRASNALRP